MLFLLLTIGPAFLFACGNILEKSGVSTVGKRTGGTSRPWEFFKGVITNKFWWLGIACSGLATVGYYIAMAQYDLSQVQPMMVLNPVLTALMGFCILKEVLTKRIVVAICFVVAGLCIPSKISVNRLPCRTLERFGCMQAGFALLRSLHTSG